MKCVFGCDASEAPLHRFPNPKQQPKLVKKWLDVITNAPDINQRLKTYLQKLDPTMLFNSIFKVCDHHFKREHKTPDGRIMYGAVPSISLRAILKSDTLLCQLEHNYSSEKITEDTEISSDKPYRFIFLDEEDNVKRNTKKVIVDETKLFSWQRDGEVVCDESKSNSDSLLSTEKNNCSQDSNVIKAKSSNKENIPNVGKKPTNNNKDLHEGYKCDICKGPIYRFRYACVQCVNYDLCSACEGGAAHAHHYLLRVPRPSPYGEVQLLIDTMKQILSSNLKSLKSKASFISNFFDDIKSEVVSDAESDPLSDEQDCSFKPCDSSDQDVGFEVIPNLKLNSNTSNSSIPLVKSVSARIIPDPLMVGGNNGGNEGNATNTATTQTRAVEIASDADKHISSNKRQFKMVTTTHPLIPLPITAATPEINFHPEVVRVKEEEQDDNNTTATPQEHTDEAVDIDEDDIIWLDEELLEENEIPRGDCDNTKNIDSNKLKEDNVGNENSIVKLNNTTQNRHIPRILKKSNNHPPLNSRGKVNKTMIVALPKKTTIGSDSVKMQQILKTIKHILKSKVCIQVERLTKEEIKSATNKFKSK